LKPIVFHPEANEEFEASVAYYENRRDGLGSDFREEVETKIWLIRGDPSRCPVFKSTDAQKSRLKRFPYQVIDYETTEEIWVVAVAHDKRKPGYWRDRLP
jgi:hypothetical protein